MREYSPPAKLNIFLDILSERKDGYHDILSLMVKVNLCDRLRVEKISTPEVILETEGEAPKGEDNICFKTAEIIRERFGIQQGVKIKLVKNIPLQSGLGGASSDCAGVIKLMNEIFSLGLSPQEEISLGLEMGSDVPFFIHSATWAIVEGRGDRIRKLSPGFCFYAVVIIPEFGIETKWAYSLWTPSLTGSPYRDRIKSCKSEEIDLEFLKKVSYNIFEHMLENPTVEEYQEILKRYGAEIVRMTGSGSAIYGIFTHMDKAENVREELSSQGYRVYLVSSI